MSITKIRAYASVTRETDVFERSEPVIVTLNARHMEIRVKRSKETYTIGYAKLLSYVRGLACNGRTKAAG